MRGPTGQQLAGVPFGVERSNRCRRSIHRSGGRSEFRLAPRATVASVVRGQLGRNVSPARRAPHASAPQRIEGNGLRCEMERTPDAKAARSRRESSGGGHLWQEGVWRARGSRAAHTPQLGLYFARPELRRSRTSPECGRETQKAHVLAKRGYIVNCVEHTIATLAIGMEHGLDSQRRAGVLCFEERRAAYYGMRPRAARWVIGRARAIASRANWATTDNRCLTCQEISGILSSEPVSRPGG